MAKLTPLLLALCCLSSCVEPIEKQVVGNWVDTNHKAYTHSLKGRSEKFFIDTVWISFLEGGRLVTGTDTTDLVYKDDGYAYDAEDYKTRQPEDEWYTIRILDFSDTTMTLVFFWFGDTVNLKKVKD